jgi:type II secretory pathway pseudopilin PulG
MKGSGAGFTIVEILIAVVIISLTMVFVLGIFSQGFHFFLKCKDTTRLYNLAQAKMEEELYQPYDGTLPPPTSWSMFDEPQFHQFRYRINRETAVDPPRLMKVTLTVDGPFDVPDAATDPTTWDGYETSRYKAYTIVTFIARRPFSGKRRLTFKPLPTGNTFVIMHDPPEGELQAPPP